MRRAQQDVGIRTMAGRRGVNRFLESELARALRAAKRAGAPVDRIEVDPTTGKIAVILRRAGETTEPEQDTPERIIENL
jgi:hypothetical protein